ncbi:MAG TPA: ATP-binding cassette domain-containing protein [Bryobacteraceae bacterium]|nr:ATP-binding cassette domain-containing protein [Bryobacteraceae bacterium]
MIRIQNLCKSFDRRPVVRGLSFTAPDGAITGLLGANGAGKTTTLRMICGALQPESGTVALDRSQLGALLDHTGLYARLTVRENLEYFARLRGMPSSARERRMGEVLATLGLEDIAARPAARLSQGQRMRAALARAIVHAPHNLVLDEPANGLDIHSVRALRDFLRRERDAGACVVLASHMLEEVRTLCDKIVIIDRGCLAAEGTPAGLCASTASASLEDAFVKLTRTEEIAAC